MGIQVPAMEKPRVCGECIFRVPFVEDHVGNGFYQKVSHCSFAPKHLKNPWRSAVWMAGHIEAYCPLTSIGTKEEDDDAESSN